MVQVNHVLYSLSGILASQKVFSIQMHFCKLRSSDTTLKNECIYSNIEVSFVSKYILILQRSVNCAERVIQLINKYL